MVWLFHLLSCRFCYDLVYKDKVSYTKGFGQGKNLWENGKLAFFATNGWSFSKTMYEKLKGDEYGVPTPVNHKLTEMIHEIENGERKITSDNLEEFRGVIF